MLACLIGGSFANASSVLETKVKTIKGKETTLASYKPKAVLIVNTASKCGFTKQYKGLEELHEKFAEKGLVVAGFPCNQFGGQEPGTNDEIATFCKATYDVKFPMFGKVEVNGEKRHPLYTQLAGEKSPFTGDIGWNFTKFLVDADGKIIARFGSGDAPLSDKVVEAIEKAIKTK
ncbi:MAG: glutathione peroxidase [Akkermansiaceae bacterium]|jgi:glutathione peroxidase